MSKCLKSTCNGLSNPGSYLLARAILPRLRHTRGAARGRRKSPRRLLGLGSAAFSPFYCDKNPDGERPAFWKTGL